MSTNIKRTTITFDLRPIHTPKNVAIRILKNFIKN